MASGSQEEEPGRDHRPTPGSENAPTRSSHEDVPRRNVQLASGSIRADTPPVGVGGEEVPSGNGHSTRQNENAPRRTIRVTGVSAQDADTLTLEGSQADAETGDSSSHEDVPRRNVQLASGSQEEEPGRDHPTPGSENAPTRSSHENVPRRNVQLASGSKRVDTPPREWLGGEEVPLGNGRSTRRDEDAPRRNIRFAGCSTQDADTLTLETTGETTPKTLDDTTKAPKVPVPAAPVLPAGAPALSQIRRRTRFMMQ